MSLPPEAFEIQDDMARAPLGGTLSDPDAAGRVSVLADAGEAAQAGLAVLGAFYGGHRHRFRTRLRLGRAGWCRIEVHGNVGRMQKIVAHVAAGGEVLLQAEEVEELLVTRHGDELEIEMIFRAAGSMVEWLYILGRELTPGEGPVLQCRETSLQVLETADPERLRRHQPAQVLEGVHIACQAFTVLQGTFTLKLEIHRPGHQLTGLSLEGDLPLAHLRWWTWDRAALAPRGDELQPQHPAHPLRSPALMDVFGTSQANQGHAISGIFADWQDMEHMGLSEYDAQFRMRLRLRFDDGRSFAFPLQDVVRTEEHWNFGDQLMKTHLKAHVEACAPRRPVFLDVGARGPHSANMRRMVEPDWRYLGLDYKRDENVDIQGDAHRLTDVIEPASVDMVHSSEVMEHLLSPLRFVLEANRVLRQGGLFVARMPTIWPLHAEPWDFWRISAHGWGALLNQNTGFEILDRCEVGQVRVVPLLGRPGGVGTMAGSPAPMMALVVARKTHEVGADNSGWSENLRAGDYDHA